MTPQRHQQIGAIFLAALDVPAAQRAALLARLCGDDTALRREVDELLARDARTALLDTPLQTPQLDALAGVPARIGAFEVLGLLGEGGMGAVYRARQAHPPREVALKVINAALLTPAMLRRFEFETRVLADLQHPGIAQIFEAGTAEIGARPVPYFAMELVEGQPLTVFAQQRGLDRRARLGLLRSVCDAVHHAHQKGVIHRDLKPANILVTRSGQPKLLDFGVARAATSDDSSLTLQTLPGQIIGTIPYMSPEQLAGNSAAIDLRCDVYALGVIAYELLAGELPFDLRGRALPEAIRIVASAIPAPLGRHERALRGDVETIVARAIERDPERRYASAAELGREIERYLRGEAIEARRDSGLYVLGKALSRHRAAVASAAAFVLLLAVSTAVALNLALRAEQRATETAAVANFQAELLRGLDPRETGLDLRRHLREQVRAGLAREAVGELAAPQRRSEAEIDAEMAAFERVLASAQLTDVARRVLDEALLAPAAARIDAQFSAQPLVRAQLRASLGATCAALGLHDLAETHWRVVLELYSAHLPASDERIAVAMSKLASVLAERNQHAGAAELYEQALSAARARFGDQHAETAALLVQLGAVRGQQGRFDEALQLQEQALPILRRAGAADVPRLMSALNAVSELHRRRGDFSAAEQAQREAIELCRKREPESAADLAKHLNNLAILLIDAGRYTEAEPLQREALTTFQSAVGDEHPHTLSARLNLANTLRSMGQNAAAATLYRETVALSRQFADPRDAGLAYALNGLGLVLQAQGQIDQAEPVLREAIALLRSVLGPDHPDLATALNNLASILHARRALAEAEPLYRRALQIRRAVYGTDHPEVAGLMNNFAALLRDRGELAQAEALYQESIAGLRKARGDHPDLAFPIGGLARVLFEKGDYAAAELQQREALRISEEGLPPLHEFTINARLRLARSVARQQRFSEAAELGQLAAQEVARRAADASPGVKALLAQTMLEIYDAWHAAEPEGGHDAQAAQWRDAGSATP